MKKKDMLLKAMSGGCQGFWSEKMLNTTRMGGDLIFFYFKTRKGLTFTAE